MIRRRTRTSTTSGCACGCRKLTRLDSFGKHLGLVRRRRLDVRYHLGACQYCGRIAGDGGALVDVHLVGEGGGDACAGLDRRSRSRSWPGVRPRRERWRPASRRGASRTGRRASRGSIEAREATGRPPDAGELPLREFTRVLKLPSPQTGAVRLRDLSRRCLVRFARTARSWAVGLHLRSRNRSTRAHRYRGSKRAALTFRQAIPCRSRSRSHQPVSRFHR